MAPGNSLISPPRSHRTPARGEQGSTSAWHLGENLADWIQARRIEYVKVGARVMIRPETILQFVTSHTRRAAIG